MPRYNYLSVGTLSAKQGFVGGVPMGGAGFFGNTYFVDYRNGSDGNVGTSRGQGSKTLTAAYADCADNNNDRIIIDGDSAVVTTAMIAWTKNRIHVIGDNGPFPWMGIGNGARVTMGVTAVAANLGIVQCTGVRNTFTGIKWDNGDTTATNLYTFLEAGEFNRHYFSEFYKGVLLTTAGTAEVLMNGDTSQFYGCAFGDLVNERGSGSIRRPNVLLSRETVTGKVCRDGLFVDCLFRHKAAHLDVSFVYGANATDVERSLIFVNPIFINAVLATADPADAIDFGAAQTEGDVLLVNPTGVNISAFGGANLNIYVQGAVPTAATTGIAVEVAA
jgi:hypothetical protein